MHGTPPQAGIRCCAGCSSWPRSSAGAVRTIFTTPEGRTRLAPQARNRAPQERHYVDSDRAPRAGLSPHLARPAPHSCPCPSGSGFNPGFGPNRTAGEGLAPQPALAPDQLSLSAPADPTSSDSATLVATQQERSCPDSAPGAFKGYRCWDVLLARFTRSHDPSALTLTVIPATIAAQEGQSAQGIHTSAAVLRDSTTLVTRYAGSPSAHSATLCESWQTTEPVECR